MQSDDEYSIRDKLVSAEEAEIVKLLSRVNIGALRTRASSLRNVDCSIRNPLYDHKNRSSVMGGLNYHIPVCFVDGVTWMCRIRQCNITSTPILHQNQLVLSEVATYRFLSSRTRIPVPMVHDYAVHGPDNPIGVGYILMDKILGTPLSECGPLSGDEWRRVLAQFADIFVELSQHPFTEIGCLADPDDLSSMGPVLEESTIDADVNGNLRLLGPFASARDYRAAVIKHQMALILSGESYPKHAVDAYLVHRVLLDDVLDTMAETGPFFLKHMDDKGDHILVDDRLRIVGVIDWEWAQTTTQAEVFGAPLYLLDLADYYSGKNKLTRAEDQFVEILAARGEVTLSKCVSRGRVLHRLAHCISGDPGDISVMRTHFLSLMRLIFPPSESLETWELWRDSALLRYGTDADLQLLIQNHGK